MPPNKHIDLKSQESLFLDKAMTKVLRDQDSQVDLIHDVILSHVAQAIDNIFGENWGKIWQIPSPSLLTKTSPEYVIQYLIRGGESEKTMVGVSTKRYFSPGLPSLFKMEIHPNKIEFYSWVTNSGSKQQDPLMTAYYADPEYFEQVENFIKYHREIEEERETKD